MSKHIHLVSKNRRLKYAFTILKYTSQDDLHAFTYVHATGLPITLLS